MILTYVKNPFVQELVPCSTHNNDACNYPKGNRDLTCILPPKNMKNTKILGYEAHLGLFREM